MTWLTASEPTARERLIRATEDVHCQPLQAVQIAELIGSDDYTEAALLTSIDPGFAATLLRAANAPALEHSRSVGSLSQAVSTLGLERVRELAQVAWLGATSGGLGAFDAEQFWRYWRRVGQAAANVSAAHGRPPEAAFTAGLLHGLGRLALAQGQTRRLLQAQELARLSGIDLESALFGEFAVDSPTLGAALAERWGYPRDLVDSIAAHEVAHQQRAAAPGLASDVERACQLVRASGRSDGIELALPRAGG
jgi:HD-like signal output (HDOD) protein